MKSILVESGADLLIYGMGEKPVVELIRRFNDKRLSLNTIPQIAYLCKTTDFISEEGDIRLFSHAECLKDKKKQAANFRHIEEESNKYTASRIHRKWMA